MSRDTERAFARATRLAGPRSLQPWRDEIAATVATIAEDLTAYARRDAAAASNPSYVYETYTGFRAVRDYRVAHSLYNAGLRQRAVNQPSQWLLSAARLLSEESKAATGVEIHPAARIGRRFVIDHGYGTVIGEQVEVGDDCYLLQGVILGSRAIADTSALNGSTRHPSIGHRVEIGSDVLVLGPIHVGDDCRIEPGARIVTDVPSKSHIRPIMPVQIFFEGRARIEVLQIVAVPGGMRLLGAGLRGVRPAALDDTFGIVEFLTIIASSDQLLEYMLPHELYTRMIGLYDGNELMCCLANLGALRPSHDNPR